MAQTPSPAPRHPFGALLRALRLEVSLSQNQLARRSGVDPAYVNRLEKAVADSRGMPSRDVVLRLAETVEATRTSTERLLIAAGHCPESIMQAGRWEPVLGEIVDILADSRLTPSDMDDFRDLLRIVVGKWRPAARLVTADQ